MKVVCLVLCSMMVLVSCKEESVGQRPLEPKLTLREKGAAVLEPANLGSNKVANTNNAPLFIRKVVFTGLAANRCPQDRTLGIFTIRNVSNVDARFKLEGGYVPGTGDGSCGQDYASLGIVEGELQPFAVDERGSVRLDADDYYALKPNETLTFYAGGGPGGAFGSLVGTLHIIAERGSLSAAGLIQIVQDSADPNLVVNVPVQMPPL